MKLMKHLKKKSVTIQLDLMLDERKTLLDDYLFNGSVFGGQSLQGLIEEFKDDPSNPTVRMELMKSLRRTADELAEFHSLAILKVRTQK